MRSPTRHEQKAVANQPNTNGGWSRQQRLLDEWRKADQSAARRGDGRRPLARIPIVRGT